MALLVALAMAGCARHRPAALPRAADCVDAAYRGRYRPAEGAERRFTVRARVCRDAPTYIEVRGLVGGPALVVALGKGRMRLLLPRDRLVIDAAPDDPEPWRAEVGLPLTGRLLSALLRGGRGRVGAWSLRRVPAGKGERLPLRLTARHPGGDRIELSKTREAPAPRAVAWPEIPPRFRHEVYR